MAFSLLAVGGIAGLGYIILGMKPRQRLGKSLLRVLDPTLSRLQINRAGSWPLGALKKPHGPFQYLLLSSIDCI